MSFGSKKIDDAYDRWKTASPDDDVEYCENCGEVLDDSIIVDHNLCERCNEEQEDAE